MMAAKRVLVGVTGGVAAYKTAELVSALVKEGAEVRVVMTRAARQFVGPATFEALSGHPVAMEMWSPPPCPCGCHPEAGPLPAENHIGLALWADLVVVAPATAHFLARLAHGMADDLLSTLLLVNRAPLLVAPAMNTNMLEHPQVQRNLARARELGAQVVLGAPGRLACGTEGVGRMAEPQEILEAVRVLLACGQTLAGRAVLVTAGRTEEPIDPVRYVSNRSSGKTGAALAAEALRRGARVTAVWGVADVEPPAGVELVRVRSAEEMEKAAQASFASADVVIMAAAVADFRPVRPAPEKLRRQPGTPLQVTLEPTRDILAELSRQPARAGKILVGFALETGGEPERARVKLQEKGLDLLVWNDPTRPGCGFGAEENEVALLDPAGGVEKLPRLPKAEVARILFDRIERLLAAKGQPGARP